MSCDSGGMMKVIRCTLYECALTLLCPMSSCYRRFAASAPPAVEPAKPKAGEHNADLYYWYYASLSMLHMQNPRWKDWNIRTREALIKMQQKSGPSAGCWETNIRWGETGGRVFTTAMATLTLEV